MLPHTYLPLIFFVSQWKRSLEATKEKKNDFSPSACPKIVPIPSYSLSFGSSLWEPDTHGHQTGQQINSYDRHIFTYIKKFVLLSV